MKELLFSRKRPAVMPRRIVSVTDYWQRDPETGAIRRRVLVSEGGQLRHVLLADEHPALVSYLRQLAVAA